MERLLDIIIPMYNTPKEYITRALNSIIRQKNVNLSAIGVIIIDDCSTKIKHKKSWFKQSFPKLQITYIINKENVGPGVSRQNGIDISEAEYVTFLDSDDEFYGNESLYKVLSLMQSSQVNTDRIFTAFIEELKIGEDIVTMRHGKEFSCLHGLFLKRLFLNKYGIKFHDRLRYHEDTYYIGIIKQMTIDSFAYFDEVTYVWKWNNQSMVRTLKGKYNHFEDRILSLIYSNNFLSSINVDIKRKVLTDCLFILMMLCSNLFEYEEYKKNLEKYERLLHTYIKETNIFIDIIENDNTSIISRNLEIEKRPYPWLSIVKNMDEYLIYLQDKYGRFDKE